MNRLTPRQPPQPPSPGKPVVPAAGDYVVIYVKPQPRRYKITGVHLGGSGFEDIVEMVPEDRKQLWSAYDLLRVPLCVLQPFLQHRETVEGKEEDIYKMMAKRAKVRAKALKKLTDDEKEALGLI